VREGAWLRQYEAGCVRCIIEAVWRLSVIEDVWLRQFEAV
jgi:hypothetical protein